ncbi:MAG: hypothetical protein AVDCRST_MAG51-645 [uncultured Ramlibacter sp.]|uniref:DUF2783 domain-containing protein n=1 Tax=uncultured Ramlibacter sp. TaxID=260755 RepID=A0A6J4NVB9_9BURK|nr:MAG: hypothetical protein AVDCRST_MAG51-645 [uncultured Ramlibacter sp.]
MNPEELDLAYTALCNALADAGQPNTERFLAMLCLALMARCESAADVLPLIEAVKVRCGDEGDRA